MDTFISSKSIATDGFYRTRKDNLGKITISRVNDDTHTLHGRGFWKYSKLCLVFWMWVLFFHHLPSVEYTWCAQIWIYMMRTNMKTFYLGSSGLRPLLRVGAWRNSGLQDGGCYLKIMANVFRNIFIITMKWFCSANLIRIWIMMFCLKIFAN